MFVCLDHAGKTGKSYIFQAFPEQKCWVLIGFSLENAGKSKEIEPEKKWLPYNYFQEMKLFKNHM